MLLKEAARSFECSGCTILVLKDWRFALTRGSFTSQNRTGVTRKAEGVKQKVMNKLSDAAPAALLDYLLQNAGTTWLTRCQDPASYPRVAGPPGPSRIKADFATSHLFGHIQYCAFILGIETKNQIKSNTVKW